METAVQSTLETTTTTTTKIAMPPGNGNLLLSRRIDQAIILNGDIKITVYAVIGDKVRLAVCAPKSVSINREEIAIAKLLEAESEVQHG